MTHGKDLKNTTHFRHECDKRSEIQDEKARRSTVKVQKSVQIFKKMIENSSYTCLWTKEVIFRNEQEGKWIDATKKDTPPRRKRNFLTWTIWEHEVWWSGEYFARIQHSWTRASPPRQPNVLFASFSSYIVTYVTISWTSQVCKEYRSQIGSRCPLFNLNSDIFGY